MSDVLVRLADTDLTVADSDEDVRGRSVVDRGGAAIGVVDDLVIDERVHRVRLLQVSSGGFLGLGKQQVLVPVDAVTAVGTRVHIDTGRVAGGLVYDPDLVLRQDGMTGRYDHYWQAGYRAPGFPFR
jgi:sporulation protein YlmC with PRC-barrel domain